MAEIENRSSNNISRILVGNKCDLESQRTVTTDEGQEEADKYNVSYLETSSKDGKNVEEAFEMMAREILNRLDAHNITDSPSLQLGQSKDV
jgi:GTPase SAR1 family protein